jgi:hypothetical protein
VHDMSPHGKEVSIFADHDVAHPAVLVKATVVREAMECTHEMAGPCGSQVTLDTNFLARHKVFLPS